MEMSTIIAAVVCLLVLAVLAHLSKEKEPEEEVKKQDTAQLQKAETEKEQEKEQEKIAVLLTAAVSEELGVSPWEIKITF